ncbi:MAG: hypothetical protein PHR34_02150, partial [Kiritimatiellae bacterium]|nr:hypothetical protein [Kiritimatiellia bacterium]
QIKQPEVYRMGEYAIVGLYCITEEAHHLASAQHISDVLTNRDKEGLAMLLDEHKYVLTIGLCLSLLEQR